MSKIDKDVLKHLFALSRIEEEKDEKKQEKLIKDLSKILDHFNELSQVDTQDVEPVSGGTFLTDIKREDGEIYKNTYKKEEEREISIGQFSKKENNYLKIPPVF